MKASVGLTFNVKWIDPLVDALQSTSDVRQGEQHEDRAGEEADGRQED